MTLPNFHYVGARLAIVYGDDDDNMMVMGGTVKVDLSALGFSLLNPWDVAWRYSESLIPESDGAQATASHHQAPIDLIFRGDSFIQDGQNEQTYFADIFSASFMGGIQKAAQADWKYLQIGLWNGATYTYYRRYVELTDCRLQAPRGTRGHILDFTLQVRVIDPAIYADAETSHTITVTNGNGTYLIGTPGGLLGLNTKMVGLIIKKSGVDNPNTPEIANIDGYEVKISDTLTSTSERYYVDCYRGKVRNHASGGTWGAATDTIEYMRQQFIHINQSADYITVTTATASDYEVDIYWCPRWL